MLKYTNDMRFPIALCLFLFAWSAAQPSFAKVVVGPVPEEKAQPAKPDSSQLADERGRIFERIGIRVIRKGPAAPDVSNAEEMVESLIEQGAYSRDELIRRVRDESPVVVTHLVVDLLRQRLFVMNRDNHALAEYKVSTGRSGYETPPGTYNIVNKAAYAYSKKYEADMYHWMGMTSNGDIGMHGLKGSSYERILGRRASHGCVRLSRADARYLFSIIPVGMKVLVTSGLGEVVYYKPITEEDLMQLIDGLIAKNYQPFARF